MLFLLEIDDLIYAHGTSDAFRLWCENHARPTLLNDAEKRDIFWSRMGLIFTVWIMIPVNVFLMAPTFGYLYTTVMSLFIFCFSSLVGELAGSCSCVQSLRLLHQFLTAQAIFWVFNAGLGFMG